MHHVRAHREARLPTKLIVDDSAFSRLCQTMRQVLQWPRQVRRRSHTGRSFCSLTIHRERKRYWSLKSAPSALHSYAFRQSVQSKACLRGKKTKVTAKLESLPQGAIALQPVADERKDEPSGYPTVVQQARNNMRKFDNCVLLTRVGGFYEVT